MVEEVVLVEKRKGTFCLFVFRKIFKTGQGHFSFSLDNLCSLNFELKYINIYIAQYKLRKDPPISCIWKVPMNASYNVIKVIVTNSCPLVGNGDILPHTSFYSTLTDTKGSGHIGNDDFIIGKI